jgi:hypothetical protein
MKSTFSNWLRLGALILAGFTVDPSAAATNLTVQNAGFDAATGNLADSWNSGGGSIRGGVDGGYEWDASYFGGTFPTNNTFATTVDGPVGQDLTGPGSTFVAGATYELKVDLFGSSTYAAGTSRMWTLALTADGIEVAKDQWFSDEFAAQSISNGGSIPDDHIITVNSGSTGLTTATLVYTVPPAFAGQVIGIRLGGDVPSTYPLAPGSPATNDYYGMMDNVSLTVSEEPVAALDTFYADASFVGEPFTLYWTVVNPSVLASLTLDDGSVPVNVLANTDPVTGEGFIMVNPAVSTIYTLTANGGSSKQVSISGGTIYSFTPASRIVTAAESYEVTLDWSVYPPGLPVQISDGTTTYDVTADTDPFSGMGSGSFTVPNPSTTFTLDLNQSSDTATLEVLRASGNTPAFSLNKLEYSPGEITTVTWSGATGNPDSWVGIYTDTKIPDDDHSDQWNYLNGTQTAGGSHPAGSLAFTLPPGEYYAILFVDEGYTIEHGPIAFKVVQAPADLKVVSVSRTGNSVTIGWVSEADRQYHVYASSNLDGDPETDWERIATGHPADVGGTTTFTEILSDPAPARRFYRVYEAEPGF